jgi:hypothetical protein
MKKSQNVPKKSLVALEKCAKMEFVLHSPVQLQHNVRWKVIVTKALALMDVRAILIVFQAILAI